MKKTLLANINKPIKLFRENGGIVGVCEKGGRFLGQALKGIFNATRFIVEPPISAVILAGLITVDYLRKEEENPLFLTGDSEPTNKAISVSKTIDLEVELKEERIPLGTKQDIEQLLGITRFDQKTLLQQYRKRIKEVHPDKPEGSESLFNEIQKIVEEIRWTWFIDYKNLDEEDKQKFELMTNPSLRAKSYLFNPKYRNSQMVGNIKIISMASCADDYYRCRDLTNDNIVFLTEEAVAKYEV
jgi:hypothetical protein